LALRLGFYNEGWIGPSAVLLSNSYAYVSTERSVDPIPRNMKPWRSEIGAYAPEGVDTWNGGSRGLTPTCRRVAVHGGVEEVD